MPFASTVIIGAGQAGLSLAWHLAQDNLRYLLVEAAPQLGHSWRCRWDSLKLFSPSQYDSLPGMPFPAPADTYPTKDQVADYLTAYAERHAFPVLTSTSVTRLVPYDGGFAAHTSQGVLRARQVVVATGAFQHRQVPEVSTEFSTGLPQLHSSDYHNPGSLPEGPVLVVGAGNSGLQIAEELVASRPVVLAAGAGPLALPQRLAGHDLFWWLIKLGLMDKPADSWLGRRVRARGDLVIGTDRRQLQRQGVQMRPRLVSADGNTAHFADHSSAEVKAVVWATGFRFDYSWIDAPVCGPDGRPELDEGGSSVSGLWFLGLPWQRNRGSSLLGFVHRDAALVHDRILSQLHVS